MQNKTNKYRERQKTNRPYYILVQLAVLFNSKKNISNILHLYIYIFYTNKFF